MDFSLTLGTSKEPQRTTTPLKRDMSNSQDLLAHHPSVQDLDLDGTRLNPRKVHVHNLVINRGPLHLPSDHGRNSLVAKNVPKGQTVTATRNIVNIEAASKRLRLPLAPPGVVGASSPTAAAPAASPLANATKQTTRNALTKRPLSRGGGSGTTSSDPHRLTSDKLATALTNENANGGGDTLQLLPSLKVPPPPPLLRRATSVVSSKESFVGTDAESFSVYSCSCCHVKPPSSYCGGSEYDNLTSVSQRPSNHPSRLGGRSSSIGSSKLRRLEDDLRQEREDRLRTQKELSTIQERQQLLLSKLTEDERDRLKQLMASTS